MENQIFPAICVRVAEEKDPQIIELFKDSLRLLLQEETPAQSFTKPLQNRWGLD
jgi:hypothetical protein